MKLLRFLLCLAVVLLAGCKKNIQTDESVRQAVIKHLSTNKNLQVSSMDIAVSAVTFQDNEAQATVSFKPKGADASAGMQMRYTLARDGNEWKVKQKADSGAGHSGMAPGMGMPGTAAPGSTPQGEMPPNHPPVGGAKAPEKQ